MQQQQQKQKKKILLVDDEENVRLSLGFWLRRNDFQVTLCGGLEDALAALRREAFDYVISDFRLTPRGEEGVRLLEEARTAHPRSRCILVTATPPDELPAAVRCGGLFSLYQKPIDVFELLRLLGAPLTPAG
ncbi:MAG: response regulator [Gemmatimonadetes bacterium]|nr:response regulator [Gemmatimonadota bacterium]